MFLSDLPTLKEIERRLLAIFSEGTPHRNNCTWNIAQKTVFVMLYANTVEGSGNWLRPDQVSRMTDVQAAKTAKAERESWVKELGIARVRFPDDGLPLEPENPFETTPSVSVLFQMGLLSRSLD